MFTLRMERRVGTPNWLVVVVTLFSLTLGLLSAAVVFLIYGVDPLLAYQKIFVGSFGSLYGLSETVVKAIPLMLCALGLVVAFKALVWNIGAEGQLLMGATGATWIALSFPEASPLLLVPSMFAIGFASGVVWGFLPAIMKAKLKANEVITTLMMNYIAIELVKFLVYGPWKGSEEWGFPYTNKFSPSAWLPRIPDTRIHYQTLILELVLAALLLILMSRTKLGFEIKVTGENPQAASYAGMNYVKVVVLVMAISGGLAGMAGVGEVAGIHYRLRYPQGISPGYGYTAIIVAWLGRLNPYATVLASLLLGGLLVGGDAIQVSLGLPVATINIFNGLILFFILAGDILTRYRISLTR